MSACDLFAASGDEFLDLRQRDLQSQVISLNQGWSMQWGRLLGPRDAALLRGTVQSQLHPWRQLDWLGKRLSDTGVATYRLVLLVDTSRVRELSFAVREQGGAYALWVDGTKVLAGGTVGATRLQERIRLEAQEGTVAITSPRVDLVMQVSNFHLHDGGMTFPVRCSAPAAMRQSFRTELVAQALCLGMILLFAFLHLNTYLFHRRERIHLVFALFCLAWFLVVLCESGNFRILSLLLPELSFGSVHRIHKVAFAWIPYLTMSFWNELFPRRILRWHEPIALAVGICMTLATLLLPVPIFGVLFRVLLQISAPYLLLLLWVVVDAVRKGTSGAWPMLVGLLAFGAASIHDVLYLIGIIDSTYIATFGTTALVLSNAVILSRRTASIHETNAGLMSEILTQNIELKRLSQVKDAFLANTSHELRTPLHGIMGIAESGISEDPQRQAMTAPSNFRSILGSAARLARLVNDLLDFSTLRHGERKLHPSAVDLRTSVARVNEHFRHTLEHKGVAWVQDIPEGIPLVLADEDRLDQILFNLVGNAVKFTDHGCVRVQAQLEGERVRLSVQDSGIGIPLEDASRIFGSFEQGPHGRGGTGLGLSIAQQLVTLHGGTLLLDSIPGQGSTFTFELDIAPDGILAEDQEHHGIGAIASESQESELAEMGVPDHPIATLLAVDDEATNLRILRNHLQGNGYRVICMENGEDILAQLEKELPAVVLLDVMMPGKNGFEVCRKIRGHYSESELPVLFVTARNRLEDLKQGYEVGGNDYLIKPFLRAELLARVNLHVRQQKSFRAHSEPGRLAAEILAKSLRLWEVATGKDRADFAEESGLWSIQIDGNGWRRTQTLDKYLDPRKPLKLPRWSKVLDSARFAIEKTQGQTQFTGAIETLHALIRLAQTET